jgi:hypothetical protein
LVAGGDRIGVIIESADRRLLKRQIRQLQSRLQQQDEDIFTYTSSAPKADNFATEKSVDAATQPENPPPTATSRFKSYRSNLTDRFSRKPSARPIVVDDDGDDWGAEPGSNRQLDWEDSRSSRQQNLQSPNYRTPIATDRIYDTDRSSQKIATPAEQPSREVYDADFRLIQPPYKQPLDTEFEDDRGSVDFEDTQIDEAEDFDPPASATKPRSPDRDPAAEDLDEEDWGFDFDDRETPARAK